MKRMRGGREGDESELCPRWPGVGGQLMKLRASGEPEVMMELDERVKTDARKSL
jgi:hypothetical protein